jgi:RNA polymerase sigma-70 factor (ECF subfamily)
LKPEFRAVAVLRLIQGYSTREVADMLGIETGTVLSRLSRAKARLADGLREDFGND